MAENTLNDVLNAIPKIGTEDHSASGLMPDAFVNLYEIKSFRNAANLLLSAHKDVFEELVSVLSEFEIKMNDILVGGGNKSNVAKNLEAILHPLGWNETRISGDLLVKKSAKRLNTSNKKSKFEKLETVSRLENFLDGHQIDFIRDRVAFDLEWNSKDQTFDRDLYAMRTFYECGVIDVGIILTRSSNLSKMFADIGSRVQSVKSFKDKYGASTTWMGKLDYRINAGRAGGCPILALGFKDTIFTELEEWRAKNPVLDDTLTAESLLAEIDSE